MTSSKAVSVGWADEAPEAAYEPRQTGARSTVKQVVFLVDFGMVSHGWRRCSSMATPRSSASGAFPTTSSGG